MEKPVFAPAPPQKKAKPIIRNHRIELSQAEHEEVVRRAHAAGCSIQRYLHQALKFAMAHEGDSK